MILLQIDPNTVRPGWTPLIITIVMAAVIALLMISMRRHMRGVNLPYRDEVAEAARVASSQTEQAAADESEDSTPSTESTAEQAAADLSTPEAVADKAGQAS